jgi:hypothetical protein
MIDRKELQARVERLGVLACGLAREHTLWHEMLWKKAEVPLSATELEEYLAAIRWASRALTEAQQVLARACRRAGQS